MIINAELIAEALEEIKPYDAHGEMAVKIKRMGDVANSAQQVGVDVVNRQNLSAIVTGEDENAVRKLAEAYAKALRGYGPVFGQGDEKDVVVNHINWPDVIGPATGMTEFETKANANEKVHFAKDDAQGGVLIIDGIYKDATNTTEPDFAIMAEEGGLQTITDCMTDHAGEDYIPVIVLTGEHQRLKDFFTDHPEMTKLFNVSAIRAEAAPPPAPHMPTALETDILVRGPLRFKAAPSLIS